VRADPLGEELPEEEEDLGEEEDLRGDGFSVFLSLFPSLSSVICPPSV
jgi:hypothetical protein